MNVIPTPLEGLLVLEPKVHGDTRGWFMESYNQQAFEKAVGKPVQFVQDNHSFSSRGVLRGLHYQLPPHAQAKLVRCTRGVVWDVAVDIRQKSPSFGQWYGLELSESNRRQLWIPEGFAHGFVVLSDTADFLYKTTAYYAPQSDRAIHWQDPQLAIGWPLTANANSQSADLHNSLQISAKDQAAVALALRCANPATELF